MCWWGTVHSLSWAWCTLAHLPRKSVWFPWQSHGYPSPSWWWVNPPIRTFVELCQCRGCLTGSHIQPKFSHELPLWFYAHNLMEKFKSSPEFSLQSLNTPVQKYFISPLLHSTAVVLSNKLSMQTHTLQPPTPGWAQLGQHLYWREALQRLLQAMQTDLSLLLLLWPNAFPIPNYHLAQPAVI